MKSILLIIFITVFSFSLNAQCKKKCEDKMRFGFFVGANYSMLQANDGLQDDLEIYNGAGSQLGIFMDYSFNERLFISPKLEVSFNKSGVEITDNDQSTKNYEIFPVSFQTILHMNLNLGSGYNIPYLFLGPSVRFPLAQRPTTSTSFYNGNNLAVDVGIGLENQLRFFIFAPEIKYSYGISNVNKNPSIQSLNYHQIALAFNFK